MRETGNDGDVIWNMSSIYGHGLCFQRAAANRRMKTEPERQLGLLKFNYGFAQNLAQDSPKQAKNEIFSSFQLVPLFIVRFASLVARL